MPYVGRGVVPVIWFTGDLHGSQDIHKLAGKNFQQGRGTSRDDFVVVCGDFGLVWCDPPSKEDEGLEAPRAVVGGDVVDLPAAGVEDDVRWENDLLNGYLDDIEARLAYKAWYFGHYHRDRRAGERAACLYQGVVRAGEMPAGGRW